MHVTPSDLRMLRQDGTVLRFALLESMAFVLAELPSTGSVGTAMELPCIKPHWGFVVSGELRVDVAGERQRIPSGSAFHVRAGDPPHQFSVPGVARIAGFEPIGPISDTSEAALRARGFELGDAERIGAARILPASIEPLAEPNAIDAQSWSMSGLVLTQVRFGPGSGYTAEWCDAPHWGLVTAGRLAIEWEGDIEILAAGDVYHCPGGPPGHRLEAADPASVVDLTPVEAFAGGRLAAWRARPAARAAQPSGTARVAVAGLG